LNFDINNFKAFPDFELFGHSNLNFIYYLGDYIWDIKNYSDN